MRTIQIDVAGVETVVRANPMDDVGPGGAHHVYEFSFRQAGQWNSSGQRLSFQKGGIQEVGANGVSNEIVIATVIDRLKGFERGKLPCRQNELALNHLEEALFWLNQRTMERVDRGVEGKQLS